MKKFFSKLVSKLKSSRIGKIAVGVGATVSAVVATAISSFAADPAPADRKSVV